MKAGRSEVRLRAARAGDLEAIHDINRAAWDDVCMAQALEQRHGVVGGVGWRERKAGEVDAWCRAHPERVMVAEAQGRVVGYATWAFDPRERAGEVCNNAVHPDWRGRGIGTALVAQAVRNLLAEGARILRVTTLQHDLPAQRVYEKLGFREIARSIMYTMDADQAARALAALEEVAEGDGRCKK